MAGYRQFHTQFWKDEWVMNLEPLKRYLFIYLFTNDLSSISGLYKIPLKVVANETDLDLEFIKETFAEFETAQKILYADGILWVVNMQKFHKNASPTTMTRVRKDVELIPDCLAKKAYLYHLETGEYSTDTVLIGYQYPALKANLKLKQDKDKAKAEPLPLNIFTLYENEIGIITKMVSDELTLAEQEYPAEWFRDAFKEAADHNARNWKYVLAILKSWKANGRGGRNNGSRPEPNPLGLEPNDKFD